MVGQYGGNVEKEPDILMLDAAAEEKITSVFEDKGAKVYAIK